MRTLGIMIIVAGVSAASASAQPVSNLGPRTVHPIYIACADLPIAAVPAASLRILAPHSGNGHEVASPGELVVLNGGTKEGLAIGQRFYARRVSPPLDRQPISATARGSLRTAGWLTVVAADETSALARIDYACTAVQAGDYLEPYTDTTLPTEVRADGDADFANLGLVLTGPDRREAFGAGDVLTIDRGTAAGLRVGGRVGFYRDRRNGTPLYELGVGIVVEAGAEVAKVVVERAADAVKVGDYFARRGQ